MTSGRGRLNSSTTPPRAANDRVIAWLVAAIATVYMLALTVPWQPLRSATIWHFDYSWILVLHDAIVHGRQFGPELIIPYGPLGFLATNVYHPGTYLLLISIRIILSLIALRVLWETFRKFLAGPLAALPCLLAVIALMGPGITARVAMSGEFNRGTLGGSEDHFFSICSVLLLTGYFSVHGRVVSPSIVAIVVVLAVASLAKVNLLLQDLVVIGAISFDQIFRGKSRRRWLVPTVYVGCLILFYLAARQSPASAPAFLWGWIEVSAGHMNAVGLSGLLLDVLAYLFIAALVIVLVARVEWHFRRRAGLIPTLAMAMLLALLYKHSFVRQDFGHATMAPMVALAVAIIYLPMAWPLSKTRLHQGFCIVTVTLAGIVVWSSLTEYTEHGLGDYALDTLERTTDSVAAVVADFSSPSRLRRQWDADQRALRDEMALPTHTLAGPTDVYPHRQDVVLAYGLNYAPRRAFSSLFATAPALAELNLRHLTGPGAPETILFDIEQIDDQFPALADGISWPKLLAGYDLVSSSGRMLVLRRSGAPRHDHRTPITTLTGALEHPLAIPDLPGSLVWARIHLHNRVAGRVLSALYKPPWLRIRVSTADQSERSYRLLSAPAEQGFLLSPVISTRADFAGLWKPDWPTALKPHAVSTMTITVEDGSADLDYNPAFSVDLDRLEISR